MLSEKYTAHRGSVEDGMRLSTACFARAPQRCTSRTCMHFLLRFHEVKPISKTRNQLNILPYRPLFRQALTLPMPYFSEHVCPFSAHTWLCTKNPVRNLTRRSMRTFWSHFNSFLRPDRPIFPIKTLSMNDFWCKATSTHDR